VVTRYRIHLEDRQLAPGTTNVRLAAVRRLAYEAADSGLLSPELAAGIRRVKGSKKLVFELGTGSWIHSDGAIKCGGQRSRSFRTPSCTTCWDSSGLLRERAAFRGRHRETFSESRMR
jgi:hypothetical protein